MAYSQKSRPFRLTTPLGPDVLLLVDWKGEERVSSFFRFTVRAFSRPAAWYMRAAGPFGRLGQRVFARRYAAALRRLAADAR